MLKVLLANSSFILYFNLRACQSNSPNADIINLFSLKLLYNIDNQYKTIYTYIYTRLKLS